jgi:hypothetical protein
VTLSTLTHVHYRGPHLLSRRCPQAHGKLYIYVKCNCNKFCKLCESLINRTYSQYSLYEISLTQTLYHEAHASTSHDIRMRTRCTVIEHVLTKTQAEEATSPHQWHQGEVLESLRFSRCVGVRLGKDFDCTFIALRFRFVSGNEIVDS